jgi:hypothetical protein
MMQTLNMRATAPAARRASAPRRSAGFRMATTATARVDKCDKKQVMVSPSILSANFAKLGEQARGRRRRGVAAPRQAQPWP